MKHCVFVYGSLKSGFYNHGLLQSAKLVTTTTTKDHHYRMISLGAFPAVVNSGENAISGELYEVNTYTLMLLDMLEGNGVFYERTEVELESGHKAWLYFLVVDLEPAKDQSRVLTENKVQTWIMSEDEFWASNPPGV